ncbi:Phosphoglycerate kinase [Ehrlichia ruminantium str. Gardel]|uniref:phosphoglycerate kinase n=1 Tax=Ehrlichia ruminantium TaxID=779 RepID=UPI00004C76A3|nr:phosphoglycerate kinase [Ehrlichia ruminantium]CAI27475.1 Phosphoglycerate kinase [Ehrlichia ruminantium str. Gardel]
MLESHDFTFANMKKIQDFSCRGKTILLRVDLNVPVDDNKVVLDDTRIVRLTTTVKYLLSNNAKIVMISHYGRPKSYDREFSLKFLVEYLNKIFATNVLFVDGVIGSYVEQAVQSVPLGSVLLLENLRFYVEEEKNDLNFAKQLALLADVYVNDAFSCMHRKHASIDAVARLLPSFIGFNFQEELKYLSYVVSSSDKPVGVIVGGAKISTKIHMLRNLTQKVNFLILGGAIANNFLLSQGLKIGNSLCEKLDEDPFVDVINFAKKYGCEIIVPEDYLVTKDLVSNEAVVKNNQELAPDDIILDIGPHTINIITSIIGKCRTVLWNGPMGMFEKEPFSHGTFSIARLLAEFTKAGKLKSIVGGGDSICAIKLSGLLSEDFTYISTGGGALLHFLSLA